MNYRFKRQVELTPEKLNFNALTFVNGVANTSDAFSLEGASELDVYISLTRVANTSILVELEVSPVGTGNDWYNIEAETIAGGTGTLDDYTNVKAAATTQKFRCKFGMLNAKRGRLVITSTGGTTDTITVRALIGQGQ